MPIEFFCQTCHVKMRTPDDAAGKLARCPKCGQLARVPTDWPADGSKESIQDIVPMGGDAAKPQPFDHRGPQRAAEVRQASTDSNPFSTPSADRQHSPAHYQRTTAITRQNLLVPGIFLIIAGAIPLAASLFFTTAFVVQMIDRGPKGENLMVLIITSLAGVMALLSLLGGVAMVRRRGYGLAIAGSISALLLGALCCFLPTPFGVWALVVLLSSNCRSAFNR